MNFLFYDSETTGLNPDTHGIVEIAMIPIINGVKGKPFVSKLKPFNGSIYDPKALEINKLNFNEIQTFPEEREVLTSLIKWIESHNTVFNLAGQNISFDRKFLKALFSRHGCMSDYLAHIDPLEICTLGMAKQLRVKSASHKLGDLCKYFNIKLENAHTALADIEATWELYQHLKAMIPSEIAMNEAPLSYQEKRRKYLDSTYVTFNAENDIYITRKMCKDPSAARFIAEEIYRRFC